ncbi:MAG: hypothetical protein ACI8S6_005550 [Myxococcota bacterium]|jgi:hypothetical protein
MTAQPTSWSSLLKTALPAVFLLSVGSWPIVTHPHAEAYQPWLMVGLALCCLIGGAGAAGSPQATTITTRRLGRGAMVAALVGLVALSAMVLTDALCLSGYRIADGTCAWE